MKKTTLYMDEADAERLRCLSAETGKSQAALIRDAIAGLVANGPRRTFHSMAIGASTSPGSTRWEATELFNRVMGRE
ncbi:MAG: ribbon-helix-helix protein, CopG family [Chloroflexota bacterium]